MTHLSLAAPSAGFNFPDPSRERRVMIALYAGLAACFLAATILALATSLR